MKEPNVLEQAINDLAEDNPLKQALYKIAEDLYADTPAPEPACEPVQAEQTAPPALTVVETACPLCLAAIEGLRDKWDGVAKSGASYSEFCAEFCADLDVLAATIQGVL